MEKIKVALGTPQRIKVDNSLDFQSRALEALAYLTKVKFVYSPSGTPTDNPHIESFNCSFRDGCLNMNWFLSLEDTRDKIERWRRDYNEFRPHSALINLTLVEFIK
ncbi:MAG: transposase [Desulfobulbaceae bacterium]|nr:transposase [Desulfobulbaceae bacterium]